MKIWLSVHIDEEQLDTAVEYLIEMLNISEEDFYLDEEDPPLNEDNIEKTE